MQTLVLIPGLVSDSIVWQSLGAETGMPIHHADVTRDSSITGMAERLLSETEGALIVVGHSMGGRVAMEMARIAPDRVAGLVLANTGHHPKRDGEEVRRLELVALAHRDMDRFIAQWLPPMLHPARIGDAELTARLGAMVKRVGTQAHERQIQALIDRPNAGVTLADIRCPALLIAARHDQWSPVAQHQEIAEAVADAELVVIEDAGHFAPVERSEAVNAAITDWLQCKFGRTQ